MKPCPVETCETPTPNDRHMCRHHWFMVPMHIRTAVWSAYNSYNAAARKRGRTVESVHAAAEKLRKAQREATESVNKQIIGSERAAT